MDQNVMNTISELNKRIGSLQAKRDALIRKEKEKKVKTQEKWKAAFMKEFTKSIEGVCGADYEEQILPEEAAGFLSACLPMMPLKDGKEDHNTELKPSEEKDAPS